MKRQIILFLLMTISMSSIGQITATATSTNETCGYANGTATVTPGGNCPSGFTYIWNTTPPQVTQTATGLSAGTYTVTVYCDSDSATASTTIINIAGPSCQITNIVNDSNGQCNGSISVTAVGGTPPYSFLWSNGESLANVIGLCAGTYNVTITDANGCTCVNSATITNASSVYEMNNSNYITISPNPTNGIFSIDFSNFNKTDFSIELIDVIGKIVLTKKSTDKIMTFDICAQPQGFYYIRIYNRQMILNKKILKE